MIAAVESLKERTQAPYRALCRDLELPYSSLMRWKTKQKEGQDLVEQPGPRKNKPLDLSALYGGINGLKFGDQRVCGTTDLIKKFRRQISRRDLYCLVKATQAEIEAAEQALERRIDWLLPGGVWGMDDMEKAWLEKYKAFVLLGHDMGSRYVLGIQGDDTKPNGLVTALLLESLFATAGFCPLFLKHDRGSNFMSTEMQAVMSDAYVIPLISPRHYAPYNGGTERSHQEIIRRVDYLLRDGKADGRTFRLACEVSRHETNHLHRASLAGLSACYALEQARPFMQNISRGYRKEAYDEITELAFDIIDELGEHTENARETAFRHAAETWMQLNNMIRVTQNGKVLPTFPRFWSH